MSIAFIRNRMRENGLAKLVEELGELSQIAGKMIQYPELQESNELNHPSGYNLRQRMAEEMADVRASIRFVCDKLKLDDFEIRDREEGKLSLFHYWSNNP